MLEGVDKATLEEWAKECKKKFYKKFVETLQKPMLGEIGTNAQMIEELKSLNYQYLDEMSDYADEPINDIDGGFIRHFENAEKEGKNVILEAQECLSFLGIAEDILTSERYVDKDGKICDEYGNRLSSDMEHRAFEVIPGGKQ